MGYKCTMGAPTSQPHVMHGVMVHSEHPKRVVQPYEHLFSWLENTQTEQSI